MKDPKKSGRRSRPGMAGAGGSLRAWRAADQGPAGSKSSSGRGGPGPDPAGLGARRLAVHLIESVLISARSIDDAMDTADRDPSLARLEARDRGFGRLIAATVLRRLGSLERVLSQFLERPLPVSAPRPRSILLAASAQILVIGTPAHAAINLAVEQCRRDPKAERFDKLANAVLRRVAKEGPAILAELDYPRIDIPEWIWTRWVETYGAEKAARIASASLTEAPLDLTARSDPEKWAHELCAELLTTGSIRLKDGGRIEEIPGYAEGAWWVQDAAAALPARILGRVDGLEVADLCAAPGGKSAALAVAGARVTAVDISPERLERLRQNMARLRLEETVSTVAADIAAWEPGRQFDAVLLDAPCLSTGTIRRHPDLLHLKRPRDLERITLLQRQLLERAGLLVKPGALLVYCVCSLEPEEGEGIVGAFLDAHPEFVRRPIAATEIEAQADWITPAGDLRTLPFHSPAPDGTGMDGFFAARLVKTGA